MQVSAIIIVSTLVVFVWFDICLYHQIQSLPNPTPAVSASGSRSAAAQTGSTATAPVVSITQYISEDISVKSVMLDHINVYIYTPTTLWLTELTQIVARFPSITANSVSFLGVLVALISSRVVVSESLAIRRLAVIIFQLRQLLDSLDGIIARIKMGMEAKRHVSVVGTPGYIVDGVCDAIGFSAFLIGFYVWWRRSRDNGVCYSELKCDELTTHRLSIVSRVRRHISSRFFICLCFGLQMALSSALWNRYIDRYHVLLETARTPNVTGVQMAAFKSSITWTIFWFWRLLNPHAMMQMFLLAVWLNRAQEFLAFVHMTGFVALMTLALFTEVHANDIASRLSVASGRAYI